MSGHRTPQFPCAAVPCVTDMEKKLSEGRSMKKTTDDMAVWRLRQENMSKPFPYVFPHMPPRFICCCGLIRALFLIEWGCMFALVLSGAVSA